MSEEQTRNEHFRKAAEHVQAAIQEVSTYVNEDLAKDIQQVVSETRAQINESVDSVLDELIESLWEVKKDLKEQQQRRDSDKE